MDHSPTSILPPKLDSDSMLNAERSKSILNVPDTEGAPKSSVSDSKLAVDYFNTAVTKEGNQQGATNVVLVCGAKFKCLTMFGCVNTFVRFQETKVLASKSGYMDRLVREAIELNLHPNTTLTERTACC
jgi:hypothetical protein